MRAKGTVPVYAEVPQALNRKLRMTTRRKGWTVAQVVRWALTEWLQADHAPGHADHAPADGHNNNGGEDAAMD